MTAPEVVETDGAAAAPAAAATEPVSATRTELVVEAVDPAAELARGAAAEPAAPVPPAAPARPADAPPVEVRSSRRGGWLVVGIVLAVVAAGVLVYSIREGQRHEA